MMLGAQPTGNKIKQHFLPAGPHRAGPGLSLDGFTPSCRLQRKTVGVYRASEGRVSGCGRSAAERSKSAVDRWRRNNREERLLQTAASRFQQLRDVNVVYQRGFYWSVVSQREPRWTQESCSPNCGYLWRKCLRFPF